MKTVRIGVGAGAIDIERGEDVPLIGGERGVMDNYGGPLMLLSNGGAVRVCTDTGLFDPLPAGPCTGIDLAALRCERAPKPTVVCGYVETLDPIVGDQWPRFYPLGNRLPVPWKEYPFVTHRPGNSPEKGNYTFYVTDAKDRLPRDRGRS